MAKHISIATALDKNRLNTDTVYLLLLEIDVRDSTTGAVVETIYIAHNNENYSFGGNTYISVPFDVKLQQDKDKIASATLSIVDYGRIFQAALQTYGSSLDWPARIKIINASNPSATIEIEQNFVLMSAVAKDNNYTIDFTLSAENPLTLQFPYRNQFRNRCDWIYKGNECRYAGAMATCDYTLDGTNGCRAHSNAFNFSGFFGLAKTFT